MEITRKGGDEDKTGPHLPNALRKEVDRSIDRSRNDDEEEEDIDSERCLRIRRRASFLRKNRRVSTPGAIQGNFVIFFNS